jgi:hypothetical protein
MVTVPIIEVAWVPVVTPVMAIAGPVSAKAYKDIPSPVVRIVIVYPVRVAPVIEYPKAVFRLNYTVQQPVM